jgi:hypothetical protein
MDPGTDPEEVKAPKSPYGEENPPDPAGTYWGAIAPLGGGCTYPCGYARGGYIRCTYIGIPVGYLILTPDPEI